MDMFLKTFGYPGRNNNLVQSLKQTSEPQNLPPSSYLNKSLFLRSTSHMSPISPYLNKNDNILRTKLNISDDQTNIDRYRLAANITGYHIISKLILQRIIITNFCGPMSYLR